MGTTFSIKRKTNRFYITLASLIAVFVLTFISTFITSSVFAPINTSDAESVTINIANTNYYITTEASDVELTLNATPSGTLTVGKDTVNTKTNCDGYQLYLSTASSDTTSIMNPDTSIVENVPANALILDGSDATAGDWIPATAGSFTAAAGGPQAFKDSTHNNADTWGFAVPSGSTGLPSSGASAAGAFDATYTTTEQGANLENKFAAVPTLDSPVLVQETTSANETTGVDLDVYYGVYASMSKTAGTYSNNVLYSVVAEAPNVDATVRPSTVTNMSGSSSITVITPIATSMELETTDVSVTVGGVTCPVTKVLTKDSGGMPDVLRIVCTAPSLTSLGGNLGSYNVVANVTKFAQSYTITNGVTYSLGSNLVSSVSPTTFSYNSIDDITINTDVTATGLTASDIAVYLVNSDTGVATICPLSTSNPITYVNNKLVLACTKPIVTIGTYTIRVMIRGQAITGTSTITILIPEFYTITTMQEMTAEVCNSVYAPGTYNSYSGEAPNIINKASAEAGGYLATDDGQNFIPETTLIDYRGIDGSGTNANKVLTGDNVKTYTVRKLADGNCWMTENLALPLSTSQTVEASYNTATADTSKLFTITTESSVSNADTANYILNRNTKAPRTQADASADGKGYADNYYYNWYAATATKGTSSTAAGVDVDGSICPLGWKMPSNYTVTGNNTTGTVWKDMSFSALTKAYLGFTGNTSTSTGYRTMLASPLSFRLVGRYISGSYDYGGTLGYNWSSTAKSTSNAYYLRVENSYVRPQYDDYKTSRGFNIRCLAVR